MAYIDVITLAQAKLYLRVDDTLTEDDTQITNMINSALRYIEVYSGHLMFDRAKTYRMIDGYVRIYEYPINSVISPAANVFASGTAQCTSVIATDTLVVNGLTYTAVSGDPADDTQFSIGTDTVCATSLARAINSDSRNGTLGDVSATSTGDTVIITTNKEGYAGNAVTLSQTGGTITVSGSTFSGGLDGDVEISEMTLYTAYCYGSENRDLILDVGYDEPANIPPELIQVAYEIIDIYYYGKESGKTMADLSPFSVDALNQNRRFIV
jgi:hypothetical protein